MPTVQTREVVIIGYGQMLLWDLMSKTKFGGFETKSMFIVLLRGLPSLEGKHFLWEKRGKRG